MYSSCSNNRATFREELDVIKYHHNYVTVLVQHTVVQYLLRQHIFQDKLLKFNNHYQTYTDTILKIFVTWD